ncbi:MAG: hypothetical protein N2654_02780 [Deltaproteobacteria bacterium]|nr:hypothetical protein [Deltaproteobacteria bacterium]
MKKFVIKYVVLISLLAIAIIFWSFLSRERNPTQIYPKERRVHEQKYEAAKDEELIYDY